MKKHLALMLSLCLIALTACSGGTPSAPSAPSESMAPQPYSNAASESSNSSAPASQPLPTGDGQIYLEGILMLHKGELPAVPDFLDEAQQKQYNIAFITLNELAGFGDGFGGAGILNQTHKSENGAEYGRCDGALTRWDELIEAMDAVFTREYFDEVNGTNTKNPIFLNVDGALYQNLGGRGGHVEYTGEPDTFELVSQTDKTLTFNLTGHYLAMDTSEAYTESYPIVMENTEDGWRFTQFSLTF